MPLPEPVRTEAIRYAQNDLSGDLQWHVDYFDFIDDDLLRERVGQEFYSARFLYKLWEGLRIDGLWANQAQVQIQVQQYASIYEACIHHLLFEVAKETDPVKNLGTYRTLKERALPGNIMEKIESMDSADALDIVGAVYRSSKTQVSKVKFPDKVAAAVELGIVSPELGDEIAEFYKARNYIHIHAELRNSGVDWKIDFARDAYRRMLPFRDQASAWVVNFKKS